jgi:multidrug efflux pump subunit AcrB
MASLSINRTVAWVAASTLLSWLGAYFHNRSELPHLTLLSPENSLTALAALILFVTWWILPRRKVPALLLLVLAVVHLIGGAIISVIPFSFLPFEPEQSLPHYVAHILYGLAQLPLIAAMLLQLRAKPDGGKP